MTGRIPWGLMSEHDEKPVPTPPVSAGDSTGDDRVDEALTRLDELDTLPVHDHATVVEDIHRALQDTLAEDED